jgi:hypothetical protein
MDAAPVLAAEVKDVTQPRLVKAAHEFEAQLMKEILKPMAADGALFSETGDADSCGILGEFAAEALGRALSEHGGLGIGNSIVRSLSHSGKPS